MNLSCSKRSLVNLSKETRPYRDLKRSSWKESGFLT